jgi:hypothetical protein
MNKGFIHNGIRMSSLNCLGCNLATDAMSRVSCAESISDDTYHVISTVKPKWLEEVEASYEKDLMAKDVIVALVLDSTAHPNYTW